MVLSGDGGDEAFGGYSRYKNWARHVSGPKRRPLWKRALRSPLEKCFPNKFRVEPRRNLAVGEQWMAYVQVMSHDTRRSLWRSEYRHVIEEPVEAFRNLEHANGCPEKSLAQLFDYHTYLPYDILTKVDIASMMNSLEVRTPMVDVRVAEFAATMPFDVNFRFEGPDGWSGKRILKRIVAKNFDCNFVNRPKSGFGMPLKNWITGDRDTIGNVKDRLLSRDAAILEHLEPSSVKRLIGAQVTRQTAKRLWRLLFLEEWLHQYKQSP